MIHFVFWENKSFVDFYFFRKFCQTLRTLPTYHKIPPTLRDYIEYGATSSMSQQQQFDPLRTLTPTSNLPASTASPQPRAHSPMNVNIFPRMTGGQTITAQQQQYSTGNGAGGGGGGGDGERRENLAQKGVRKKFY
jgi:hypothetical protein